MNVWLPTLVIALLWNLLGWVLWAQRSKDFWAGRMAIVNFALMVFAQIMGAISK